MPRGDFLGAFFGQKRPKCSKQSEIQLQQPQKVAQSDNWRTNLACGHQSSRDDEDIFDSDDSDEEQLDPASSKYLLPTQLIKNPEDKWVKINAPAVQQDCVEPVAHATKNKNDDDDDEDEDYSFIDDGLGA